MANAAEGKKPYTIEDFEISVCLGKGALGKVYKVRMIETKFIMALKIIKKSDIAGLNEISFIKREIEIHSHLKDENIIKLYSYFHDNDRVYIMLEYCSAGNLSSVLTSVKNFSIGISATYMHQLASALKYIHNINVIHRDIKPENLLICRNGQLKLADFGCTVHHKGGPRATQTGTLDYLAPEIISQRNHNVKVDIWSAGVVLFEMLTGKTPFYAEESNETIRRIQTANYRFPSDINTQGAELLIKILRTNANSRPTASEIIQSDLIKQSSEGSLSECKAMHPILKTLRMQKK